MTAIQIVAINIDWIGDQDSDGFTSIDSSANLVYITIEATQTLVQPQYL